MVNINLKNDIQNLINLINLLTNVDITVVNNNFQRIAGTGLFKNKIGEYVSRTSVFNKCLIDRKQYLIDDPTKDKLCTNCSNRSICSEKVELCAPIYLNGNVIGIIGMCIFNDTYKNDFLNKKQKYINFESNLSNIISNQIDERRLGYLYDNYRIEILNSLNEGIIVLNENNEITFVNKYVIRKLNLNTNANNRSIQTLFFNKGIKLNNELGHRYGPFTLNNWDFLIKAIPIILLNKIYGTLLILSDYNSSKITIFSPNKNLHKTTFDDIIGTSQTFLDAKMQAMKIADKDVSAILLGESGTGKGIFAKAIHNASKRSNEIFMSINCGAIPCNLIESELFGYEKGAFTGANISGKPGKFEIAKDGTIFLDEIGDLDLNMQVKLLTALEDKEITRVGGYKTIKINPRIIAASNKDLYKMIKENKFREDLFYRLNVIPINIPPLRCRGHDIITLAEYFLNMFNEKYNRNIKGFTNDCKDLLISYSFPGNIRELKNIVEYAINFEENEYIGVETINKKLRKVDKTNRNLTLDMMLKSYEKKIILEQLNIYGSDFESKKIISEKLGISIATLYRKIDELAENIK